MCILVYLLSNGYRQDYGPWYLAIINGEVLETTHLIDFHKDRNDGLDFIARIAGDEHSFTFQGIGYSYADLYNGYYSTSANGYSRLTNGVVIQWISTPLRRVSYPFVDKQVPPQYNLLLIKSKNIDMRVCPS